jgi:uncharacterized protein DUF5662
MHCYIKGNYCFLFTALTTKIPKKKRKEKMKKDNYKEYVDNHISNVGKVWEAFKKELKGEYWIFNDDDIKIIDNLIKIHDQSKYSKVEFDGYKQWFFGDEKTKDKDEFTSAWNHHQKSNPHHWEYWIMWKNGISTAINMPMEYVFEMLCDWGAMSLKFGGDPSEFYKKNIMLITNRTRDIIDRYIKLLDTVVEGLRKAEKVK